MDSLECLIKYWRRIATTRVTGSQVVSTTPVFLFSVTSVGDGSGNTEVDLHDGESNAEEVKFGLRHGATDSNQFSFNPPILFRKGLYVNDRGNIGDVTVQYLPIKE